MTEATSKASKQASAKPKASNSPAVQVPVADAVKPARKRAPHVAKVMRTGAAKPAPSEPAAKKSPAKKGPSIKKGAVEAVPQEAKPAKVKKAKLVRDSYTMPESEYAAIASLKKRCLNLGVAVKKSEILRAAIAGLAQLSDADVVGAIRALATIKTGRPAKAVKPARPEK